MKRISFILATILLCVSFVSCEKDGTTKTEDFLQGTWIQLSGNNYWEDGVLKVTDYYEFKDGIWTQYATYHAATYNNGVLHYEKAFERNFSGGYEVRDGYLYYLGSGERLEKVNNDKFTLSLGGVSEVWERIKEFKQEDPSYFGK